MSSKVYLRKPVKIDWNEGNKKLQEILAQQRKRKPVESNKGKQEKIIPQKDSYKATQAIAKRMNTKKVVWKNDPETVKKRAEKFTERIRKAKEEEKKNRWRGMLK